MVCGAARRPSFDGIDATVATVNRRQNLTHNSSACRTTTKKNKNKKQKQSRYCEQNEQTGNTHGHGDTEARYVETVTKIANFTPVLSCCCALLYSAQRSTGRSPPRRK